MLLDLEGLYPSAEGKRVKFSGAKRFPFEALSQMYPGEYGAERELEIRQVFEMQSSDLPPEEIEQVVTAASLEEESLSEYIRKAIGLRMHGQLVPPSASLMHQVQDSLGHPGIANLAMVGVRISRRNYPDALVDYIEEARTYSSVPDFPPELASDV